MFIPRTSDCYISLKICEKSPVPPHTYFNKYVRLQHNTCQEVFRQGTSGERERAWPHSWRHLKGSLSGVAPQIWFIITLYGGQGIHCGWWILRVNRLLHYFSYCGGVQPWRWRRHITTKTASHSKSSWPRSSGNSPKLLIHPPRCHPLVNTVTVHHQLALFLKLWKISVHGHEHPVRGFHMTLQFVQHAEAYFTRGTIIERIWNFMITWGVGKDTVASVTRLNGRFELLICRRVRLTRVHFMSRRRLRHVS